MSHAKNVIRSLSHFIVFKNNDYLKKSAAEGRYDIFYTEKLAMEMAP